jgi:hypothetical protein
MQRAPLLLAIGVVLALSPAPAAGAATFTVVPSAAAVPTPLKPASQAQALREQYKRNDRARVSHRTVAAFVPLYGRASRRFGVAWLLLASIHKQETAFSTATGTYHGLNFAHCCAGPMQFNVSNGPVSTWKRFRHAHLLAPRPDAYPNPTTKHPSVYDDYDAIMAAAQLLSANGATTVLDDGSAWRAAYLYYGPGDLGPSDFGVTYADEVVARALNWQRRGFCPACPTPPGLIAAVHKAWAPAPPKRKHKHKHHKKKHSKQAHKVHARELRPGHRRRGAKPKHGDRRTDAGRPKKDAHVRPDKPGQQPSGGQPQPQGSPPGGSGPDPGGQSGGVGPGNACVLPTGCPGAPVHGAAPSQGPVAPPPGGPAPADPGGPAQPGAAGASPPAG